MKDFEIKIKLIADVPLGGYRWHAVWQEPGTPNAIRVRRDVLGRRFKQRNLAAVELEGFLVDLRKNSRVSPT